MRTTKRMLVKQNVWLKFMVSILVVISFASIYTSVFIIKNLNFKLDEVLQNQNSIILNTVSLEKILTVGGEE
jgi:hypothetical protein